MLERKYRILMQTPIGDRAGTLEVQIEQNKIHGYLDMLNHSEPFVGSIDEEGCCCIRGRLITLMNTIPYTASGHITPDSLHLLLKGGRHLFPITGVLYP